MTGEALDVLFATSPDQFISGHRIVRWLGDMVDLPFRVTNRGVAFDGLLIKGNAPDYRAALNCRYEDDLRGVIALRLRQQDDITDRYKKREILSRDDFWVADDCRLEVLPHASNGPTPEQSSRHSGRQYDRQMTILRYHPAWQLVSNANLSRTPKFWVQFGLLNPEGFEIVDAWPPEFWNRQTGVMVPQARKAVASSHLIKGSVEIGDKRSGNKLSFAFESPARLRSAYDIRDVHETTKDGDFKIAISTSQQRARELLECQAPTFEAEFDDPKQGIAYLSVRVTEVTEILNDVVCILKISFAAPRDSQLRKSANMSSKPRKSRPSQPDSIPIINVNGHLS